MVVTEKMENRYIQLRKRLDAKGYRDVLPVDAVPLVEKIFNELIVTSEQLANTTQKADHFEKIVKELEDGVAPFKEENVRLIKENSTLRVSLLRAKESIEEQIAGKSIRAQDLEAENKEFKQLLNKFVFRVRELEADVKRKTTKILLLQERNLEAQIVGPGGQVLPLPSRRQKMEISGTGQQFCPHCVRVRNFVEYGNRAKEPGTLEYMQIADSRIEALQLQLRHMKKKELELINAITAMKCKLEGREDEITKLHGIIEVKPGGLQKGRETGTVGGENLAVALKAAQMQLNILQIRNMQLERKLQACIVMDRRGKAVGGKLSAKNAVSGDYPDYDAVKMHEKMETLEAQLSHCCAENARLKLLLEECETREKHFNTPTARSSARPSDRPDGSSKEDRSMSKQKTSKVQEFDRISDNDDAWGGEGYTRESRHTKQGELTQPTKSHPSRQSGNSHSHRSSTKVRLNAEKPTEETVGVSRLKSVQATRSPLRTAAAILKGNDLVKRNGHVFKGKAQTEEKDSVTKRKQSLVRTEATIWLSSDEFSDEYDEVNVLEIQKEIGKKTSGNQKSKEKTVQESKLGSQAKVQRPEVDKLDRHRPRTIPSIPKKAPAEDFAPSKPTKASRIQGQVRKKLESSDNQAHAEQAPSGVRRTKPSRLVSLARQQPLTAEKPSQGQRVGPRKTGEDEKLTPDEVEDIQDDDRPERNEKFTEKLDGRSKEKHAPKPVQLAKEKYLELESEEEVPDENHQVIATGTSGTKTVSPGAESVQPNVLETYRREIKRKQEEISSLEKRNRDLERKLSMTEEQATSEADQRSASSSHREQDMEYEIESWKYSINDVVQDKEKLQAELSKSEEKVRELETELSNNFDKIEKLQTKNQELETELNNSTARPSVQQNGNVRTLVEGRQDDNKNAGRVLQKQLTPENGRDGEETGSYSGRKSAQGSFDAYDAFKKSPRSDASLNLLAPPSQSRETLLFPQVVEERPSRTDWLSINSSIETYRKEVRKLRDYVYQKEDEIDTLKKDNEELERRLRSSQIRETMRTPSYSYSADHEKQDLEREISSLKFALKALDKDKDEMRMELDSKDERLYRLQQELNQNLDEMGKLQLRLKNAELHLGRSSESTRDQEREVVLQKRQIISLREDLEQMIRERDDARKEIRTTTQSNAMLEMERRNLNGELESKTREIDDLRRQVQRYVDEVRRIEDLLQRKEEEYDAILEHYRTLSAERTTLELTRTSLERETDSIKQEVREAVATNNTLRARIVSQETLTKSYEEEIERLTHQIANLEIQLSNALDSDKTMQTDATISRDLCLRLENSLSKLRLELANSESARATTEAGNRELQAHISTLESTIAEERDKCSKLEEMITQIRDKEYALQRSVQDLIAEKQELSTRFSTTSTKLEIVNQESERYRMRCAQLLSDWETLQRQFENEKVERDNAVDELRRVQQQLNTSSTNLLLTSALGRSTSPATSTSYKSPQTQIEFQFTPSSPDTPLGASTSRGDILDKYRSTSFERKEEPPADF